MGNEDAGGGGATEAPPVLGNWSGSSYAGHAIATGTQRVVIDAGYAGETVYYIVNNTADSGRSILLPSAGPQDGLGALSGGTADDAATTAEPPQPRGIRGVPGMPDPPPLEPASPELRGLSGSGNATQPTWSLGDVEQLETYTKRGETLAAEVLAVQQQDPWAVYVWAEQGAGGEPVVASTIAEEVAGRLLDAESNADIHDMVSGFLGEPWGEHGFSNLIGASRRDLHVMLYDIDGDGAPQAGQAYVVGYFWAEQNYRGSANERLMFYLDSELLSDTANTIGDGDTSWSADDAWPREAISTLAHEYQHMLHFYQRWVRRGPDAAFPTWLNEMLSLATEDLLARELGVPGPRSVNAADGSAGGAPNTGGRLPDYIAAGPATPLTVWDNSLDDYAVSYSFGAYMLRSFGPEVLTRLMLEADPAGSPNYGEAALAAAASVQEGAQLSFAELSRRWAVAMFTSNDLDAAPRFRINTGGWIGPDRAGGQVGSINLWNYRSAVDTGSGVLIVDGPVLLRSDRGALALEPDSHLFATGGVLPASGGELSFSLPEGVSVTVLTR